MHAIPLNHHPFPERMDAKLFRPDNGRAVLACGIQPLNGNRREWHFAQLCAEASGDYVYITLGNRLPLREVSTWMESPPVI